MIRDVWTVKSQKYRRSDGVWLGDPVLWPKERLCVLWSYLPSEPSEEQSVSDASFINKDQLRFHWGQHLQPSDSETHTTLITVLALAVFIPEKLQSWPASVAVWSAERQELSSQSGLRSSNLTEEFKQFRFRK